jgi:hypothetical protein
MPCHIKAKIGIIKLTNTNPSKGSTKLKALTRLRNIACASFFFNGVPSAAVISCVDAKLLFIYEKNP